jgi:hypothetical protein
MIAGLFVDTQDVVLGAKELALPLARIEVENRGSLLGNVGLTRKESVLILPWFESIPNHNPLHHAPADRFAQGLLGSCGDIGQGLATQRLLGFCDQFTGDGLDQHVVERGKNPPCGLLLVRPPEKSLPWPKVAPSLHRTHMQLHPIRGLDVGHMGLLLQKQNQCRPLPQLVLNGPLRDNLFSLLQESRGKRRAVARSEDHAWEKSFGNSDISAHQKASHCSNNSSPKTVTLFLN